MKLCECDLASNILVVNWLLIVMKWYSLMKAISIIEARYCKPILRLEDEFPVKKV